MKDLTERKLVYLDEAIDAVCMEWCNVKHQDCKHPFDDEKDDYYWCDGCETVLRTLPDLPSAQPEPKSRQQFEKSLYDMFDHIWDVEIDHPVFQDTVGELMEAVLQAFDNAQPEIIRCKNCIHLGHAYMMPCKNCRRNQMLPDWYEVETERREDGEGRSN